MSCKSLTSPDSRCKVSDPAKHAFPFEESDDAAAEDVIGAETGELVVDLDDDGVVAGDETGDETGDDDWDETGDDDGDETGDETGDESPEETIL